MLVRLGRLCYVLVAYVYQFVWCLVRCISSLIQSGIIKKTMLRCVVVLSLLTLVGLLVCRRDSRVQIFEERVMHVLLK